MASLEVRARLAAILRSVGPTLVLLIAQEAARSSGASSDERRAYETFLSSAIAPMVELVSLPDEERERALAAVVPALTLQRARVVPPVARVGLLEIGLRVMRTEIAAAVPSDDERAALERELALFGDQLRAAVTNIPAAP